MFGMPGESVVEDRVPGGWREGDETQATATVVAAAYHVCRQLLPLHSWGSHVRRYAIALPSGSPAVLEVSVMMTLGKVQLSLRVPVEEEQAGQELLDRMREQVTTMAPERKELVPACHPGDDDDLPF